MKVLALLVLFAVGAFADDVFHENDPICRDQLDGQKVQNLNDCSQYFQCVADGSYLEQCPDNTLFNSVTQQCDFPENVNCLRPIVENFYPDCSGLENGETIADPNDRTRYYVCDFGEPLQNVCEVGLTFDAQLGQCNWAN